MYIHTFSRADLPNCRLKLGLDRAVELLQVVPTTILSSGSSEASRSVGYAIVMESCSWTRRGSMQCPSLKMHALIEESQRERLEQSASVNASIENSMILALVPNAQSA